ncbi:putative Type-4 uracil-DNA glycosylase [Blattamonas nauphoetae]|uniref:Type-4 uracil-DNA glycosylase n=1 Tax=Blattamonas nauphoetae TaxID=2049346 RepID=A0ABQ9XA87_9EUKA|nr:putative Type-4 uracil-DNA glycosylase [Blattamonas nauphoetae]
MTYSPNIPRNLSEPSPPITPTKRQSSTPSTSKITIGTPEKTTPRASASADIGSFFTPKRNINKKVMNQFEKAQALEVVRQKCLNNLSLPLRDTATTLVFGRGNADARLMIIGESPGAEEDRQGQPFVGASGRVLKDLLKLVDLDEGDIYICNVIKYRPPQNRDAHAPEIKAHAPYLIDQVKIVEPDVIVTMGNLATKFVLNGFNPVGLSKQKGIFEVRGVVYQVYLPQSSQKCAVFPTLHPAATLHQDDNRQYLYADMNTLGQLLKAHGTAGLIPQPAPSSLRFEPRNTSTENKPQLAQLNHTPLDAGKGTEKEIKDEWADGCESLMDEDVIAFDDPMPEPVDKVDAVPQSTTPDAPTTPSRGGSSLLNRLHPKQVATG